MIVFAGLIPHNPLLLQDKKFLQSSSGDAVHVLNAQIALTKVTTLVLISHHAAAYEKKYTMQFATEFSPTLKKIGIIDTGLGYTSNIALMSKIQTHACNKKLPLQISTVKELDYGTAVTLKLLQLERAQIKLVVLGTANRSIVDHMEFGYQLKDVFQNSNERIGILVSADASKRHASDSPAGFSTDAEPFDTSLITAIENRSISGLTKIVHETTEPDECITRALALCFGMLRRFPIQTKLLSYEIRYGVGLLCANLFSE